MDKRAAALERAATKYTVDENGCWVSTYSAMGTGYAQVGYWDRERQHSVMMYAHRASWEYHRGPIPDNLTVDHVWDLGCRSLKCVNPAHLEPVSRLENVRRQNARN